MSKRKPSQDAIDTTAEKLPRRCPACIQTVTTTRESGAVTRLTCTACQWTERYRVVDAV
jgi:hypothetical protein